MKSLRWNRKQDDDGPLSEVNMTPLIDVSLVLVVILLLATPLAFEASLALKQSATAETDVSEEAIVAPLSVEILSDTEVKVGDMLYSVQSLPNAVSAQLALSKSREVAIRCAAEVSHGTFVQVVDIAKLSGAVGIAIAGN